MDYIEADCQITTEVLVVDIPQVGDAVLLVG